LEVSRFPLPLYSQPFEDPSLRVLPSRSNNRFQDRREWDEVQRSGETRGLSENNRTVLPIESAESQLFELLLLPFLPFSYKFARRIHVFGVLAEGDELGSNLLHVLDRRPTDLAHLRRSLALQPPLCFSAFFVPVCFRTSSTYSELWVHRADERFWTDKA